MIGYKFAIRRTGKGEIRRTQSVEYATQGVRNIGNLSLILACIRCSGPRNLLRDPNDPSLNINLRISPAKRHKRRCFKVGTS